MRVSAKRDLERPCETEVGKLEISIPVYEEVLRLEFTVKYAVGVAVVQAFYELVCEALEIKRGCECRAKPSNYSL